MPPSYHITQHPSPPSSFVPLVKGGQTIVAHSAEDGVVAAAAFAVGRLAGNLKLRSRMASEGILRHLNSLKAAAQPGAISSFSLSNALNVFVNLKLPVNGGR
eukprot:scaffold1461_cov23-Prasinocladus_malaysianus.AAC.1